MKSAQLIQDKNYPGIAVSAVAKWLSNGLQIRVDRFISHLRSTTVQVA